MNLRAALRHHANMQQPIEESIPATAVDEGPLVCPVCWDHSIEKIEGVALTASTLEDRPVSGAQLYHCTRWHVFAIFDRIIKGEIVRAKSRHSS